MSAALCCSRWKRKIECFLFAMNFFICAQKKKKEGRVSFCFEYWQTKGGRSVISQTVVDY